MKIFKIIIILILNLLFPKFCEFCGTEGNYLCDKCEKSKFVYYLEHECHVCRKISKNELVHRNCKSVTNLNGAFYVIHYDKSAKYFLKQLKYHMYYTFAEEIGRMLAKRDKELGIKFDLIAPVPLHFRKVWYRGFNQSELLIKGMGLPVSNVLRRVKHTKTQVLLKKAARQINLQDAFSVKGDVKDKRILLVDDVMTTGTTLEECAKALRSAGAKEVFSLAWARGD